MNSRTWQFLFCKKNKNINILTTYIWNRIKYAILLLNKENFAKLTKITFGNYFIQKLIKIGNNEQKIYIFKLISTNYVDISEKITIFYRIHKLYENMII